MTLLLLSLACTSTEKLPSDSAGDTALVDSGAADTGAADTGDSGLDTSLALNGEWAAEPTPAPEFAATNRDGGARARPDLIGHPTVIWFYPAAGTGG